MYIQVRTGTRYLDFSEHKNGYKMLKKKKINKVCQTQYALISKPPDLFLRPLEKQWQDERERERKLPLKTSLHFLWPYLPDKLSFNFKKAICL